MKHYFNYFFIFILISNFSAHTMQDDQSTWQESIAQYRQKQHENDLIILGCLESSHPISQSVITYASAGMQQAAYAHNARIAAKQIKEQLG